MPSFVVIWIWLCAYLNCVGWTLSWLHQLNAGGYAVALALGLAAALVWQRTSGAAFFPAVHWSRLRHRFRRGFPLAFLILAALAFLGGALHGANNYDTLAYRTPRVLHWLAAGQWHWVHTDFPRLNTRTAGFEWLTAPLLLFLKTDQFIFLLNVIAFLLLPGRVFAVLTRLGVRPRAAWHWMWLFPTGYGYVLEAGSVVNDMFGALMALAALEFALRAGREKNLFFLWTAGLAAGLMTAVKAFNLMLLLPWVVAALPALPLLWRRPFATVAVVLLAITTSMIPTSILDAKYCGDWTGANIEYTPIGGGHELLRLPVTSANLVLANLAPPVFPFDQSWEALVQRMLPERFKQQLPGNFEPGMTRFQIADLQVEESAGLGCGLTLMLLMLLGKKVRHGEIWPQKFFTAATLVPLGAWAGFGVFVLRVGISGPARYLLPFYLLLAVPMLTGPMAGKIFQRCVWRVAAYMVFVVAGLLLVVSPQRPLWPASAVLQRLDAEHSRHRVLNRLWNVYSVYDARADCFAPVRVALPPDANPLGFVTFDEPETSLWRPFGSRRILHVRLDDTAAEVRARGLKYVLVSETFLAHHDKNNPLTPADWLGRFRAEQVAEFTIHIHAGKDPETWMLTRMQ